MEKQSPVLLNCWKHHLNFITLNLKEYSIDEDISKLIKNLKLIGESQMDLYTGSLSTQTIFYEVLQILKKDNRYRKEDYKLWLQDNSDYQTITLSDTSLWTLRLGSEEDYIHIHPGRYSPHTIRIKASTLKTAIMIIVIGRIENTNSPDLQLINKIRKKYLNLPPLKNISSAGAIFRIVEVLNWNDGGNDGMVE